MSLCQKCKLKIKLLFFCSLCRNQFCSCNCLINHINSKHSSKLISGKNYIIQNPLDNLKKSSYNNYGYIINLKPYILTKEEFNLFEILKSNNNDYQIGSGAFSKVYLGKHKPTNELYAIKKISLNELNSKTDSIEIINREIELHSKLYHKNITHLVATYQNEENIYIILEYLNKGDLYKLIKKKKNNDEETCFKYFIQILSAVLFLHENNLIHRDIKPENIMVSETGYIKMIDFGTVKETNTSDGTTHTSIGTPHYMAPEVIRGDSYNRRVDYWSIGVCIYEFICGKTPFAPDSKDPVEIYKSVQNDKITFPNFVKDKDFIQLINSMLEKDINKRKFGPEIKDMNWFNDYDYKSLSEMNTQVPTKPMMSDIEDKGSGKCDYLTELKNLYNKYQKGKDNNVQLSESQIQKGEDWLKNF